MHSFHRRDLTADQLRGSSILCTIIMFAIIQGLYIMRQDEGDLNEQKYDGQKEKRNTKKKQEAGSIEVMDLDRQTEKRGTVLKIR
ncbi:MAG: hypothetical protein V8R80_02395 [Eubacterium sp.]